METKICLAINEGDRIIGIRKFLSQLLAQNRLDALLILLERDKLGNVSMALVDDPETLNRANPLAPVMPRNAAQLVSDMTRKSPSSKNVGIVARPCELRALIELVKLGQANLDKLVLLGIDCTGTCTPTDYKKYVQAGSQGDWVVREACQVCEYPSPVNADITIGFTGKDAPEVLLEANTLKGEKLLQDCGFPSAIEADMSKRKAVLAELVIQRKANKDNFLAALGSEVTGPDKLLDTLAPCVNCHNCRVMCPICYCRECFFDSPTFDWESDKYLSWAKRKGALKMPSDTLLFHLTRLNHMATSCVGCGMCSQACPNNVPVFEIFKLVGTSIQKELDYVPGKSLDEEPPLTGFKEDELNDIGR